MRITPPYVAVEPWIWNDPRVRALGRDARGLFGLLLTCPQMTKVPGLLLAGTGALADEWQGTVSEFKEVFKELQDAGLCLADWGARVVYVVPLLTEMVCNRPNGPSQAAAFGTVLFRLAPDCELTRRVDHDLRQLMLNSPALMASYLRCRPMSTEDARQQAGVPLPTQPRQMALNLPEAPEVPEPAAAPAEGDDEEPEIDSAGGESDDLQCAPEQCPGEKDSPPAPRLVAAWPEHELADGMAELIANAGESLALPPSGLTATQRANLAVQWRAAYEAGWRRQDLADLGTWIGAGGLQWLRHCRPAAYLSSYLGDALVAMDQRRKKGMRAAPARAPAHGEPRFRWWFDTDGSPGEVDDGATEKFIRIKGDPWEKEQLQALYQRHLTGERLTIKDIKAVFAQENRPGYQPPGSSPARPESLRQAG